MKNKPMLEYLSLCFLIIVLISPVFADDSNFTAKTESDTLTDSVSDIDYQYNTIHKTYEKNNQKSIANNLTANTYEELLLYSKGNKPICLNKSREYKITEKIDIYDKNLTIYGNGATIRGTNNNTQFLYSGSSNVILNNINFLNIGNKSINGSIAFTTGKITINNCTVSNSDGFHGGAFYARNGVVEIINTTFNNVSAVIGGCLYADGDIKNVKVINSTFMNNQASADTTFLTSGAAIYNGAYYDTSNMKIENCKFINNYGKYSGAVIYNNRKLTIDNCEFINNKCDGFFSKGGVLFSGNVYNITNSKFINNSAYIGGAICDENYNGGVENDRRIINSTFINNNAYEGGSIFIGGNIIILNSKFINSTAQIGGAIRGYVSDQYINNSEFTNNNATNGSAIYSERLDDVIIHNSTFNNNVAILGTLYTGNTLIVDSKFSNNKAQSLIINSENKTIINSTFNTKINLKFDKETPMLNQDITITAALTDYFNNPLNNRTINIKVGSQTYKRLTDKNGLATLNIKTTSLGTTNVTANYNSVDDYISCNITKNFDTKKIGTKFLINDIKQTQYTDNVTISGKFTDINGNNLRYTPVFVLVNNVKYTVKTDDAGTFKHTFKATTIGKNNVTIYYLGNTRYDGANKDTSFNVVKKDTKFTVNSIGQSQYSDYVTIGGKYSDVSNNCLRYTPIFVSVNGNRYSTSTDANGLFSFRYKTGVVGVNNVTVSYPGNVRYQQASAKATFNVVKKDTKFTVNSIGQSQYSDYVVIGGKYSDVSNNCLRYTPIFVSVNGIRYSTSTDANGLFSFRYKTGVVGVNNVTVSYPGNVRYQQASAKATFNVVKKDTKFTVNSIGQSQYSDYVVISGKYSDVSNNCLRYTPIFVSVNGNRYSTSTDANGLFSFRYKTGVVGVNNVTVSYPGNVRYQQASVKATFNVVKKDTKFTINPINQTKVNSKTIISGKFMDKDGNSLRYTPIKIKINEVVKTINTDKNGIYTTDFTPNQQGIYSLEISYNGNARYSASNTKTTIKVL